MASTSCLPQRRCKQPSTDHIISTQQLQEVTFHGMCPMCIHQCKYESAQLPLLHWQGSVVLYTVTCCSFCSVCLLLFSLLIQCLQFLVLLCQTLNTQDSQGDQPLKCKINQFQFPLSIYLPIYLSSTLASHVFLDMVSSHAPSSQSSNLKQNQTVSVH